MSDVFLLRANEPSDEMPPLDAAGNYEEPTLLVGASMPPVTPIATLTNRGRRLDGEVLQWAPKSGASINANQKRSVGAMAILWWDIVGQDALGQDGFVVMSGGQDAFAVRLEVVSVASRTGRLRFTWRNAAGGLVEPDAMEFELDNLVDPIVIMASREWSDDGFTVRYAVGDNDGGVTVEPVVDVRDVAAGDDIRMGFEGTIDMVHVVDRAITIEEAQWTARRFLFDMPQGYAGIRQLVPPGVYSEDEDSTIQRELQVQGALGGIAANQVRRLSQFSIPSRAWGDVLVEYEKATRQNPEPGASIARRRNRVGQHYRRPLGFNPAELKQRFVDMLDVNDADFDLDVVEYDSLFTDDFSAQVTGGSPTRHISGHNPRAWLSIANSYGTILEPASGRNLLRMSTTLSGGDLNYKGYKSGADNPPFYIRHTGAPGRLFVQGRVRGVGTLPNDALVGLVAGSRRDDEWLWFGIMQVSGFIGLYSIKYMDGTLAVKVQHDAGWLNDNAYLRLRYQGDGAYDVSAALTDTDAAWDAATVYSITGGPVAEWAGLGLAADEPTEPSSDVADADFDDFEMFSPEGAQRFSFQVHRLVSGGNPDLDGARQLLERVRPAHTEGHIVEELDGLYFDDAATLLDRDPLGDEP